MKNIELIRNVVDNLIRVSSEKSTQRGIFLACVAGGIVSKSYEAVRRWEGDALNFLAPSALASFMHAFGPALPPKLSQAQKNNSASYEGWEIFLRASPVKKTLL